MRTKSNRKFVLFDASQTLSAADNVAVENIHLVAELVELLILSVDLLSVTGGKLSFKGAQMIFSRNLPCSSCQHLQAADNI